MITAFLVVLALVAAFAALWLARRSTAFTFFLAGAFLVSCGTLLYLYLVSVSVPLIGKKIVLDPSSHLLRACVHALMFLLCLGSALVRQRRSEAGRKVLD